MATSRLARLAASFVALLAALLCGGALLLSIELAYAAVAEPAVLGAALSAFAPLLPFCLLVAAVGSWPWSWLAGRATNHASAPLIFSLLLSALAVLCCVAAAWLLRFRSVQLPWHASVLVGVHAAAIVAGLALLLGQRRPSTVLLLVWLTTLVIIAQGALRQVAPQFAPYSALFALLISAMLWPKSRTRTLIATAAALFSLLGLWRFAHRPHDAAQLVRRATLSTAFASTIRAVADFDADGSSALLGGLDCDDFDSQRHPGALEIAGNTIDENCNGYVLPAFQIDEDLAGLRPSQSMRTAANVAASGAPRSLPDILMLSLDAVRADQVTAELMPHTAGLARRGLHAKVAYTTAPYTGHSLIGAMTSTPIVDFDVDGRFFGYERSLANHLRAVGYRSVAIHCLVDLSADMVIGFDEVDNRLGPRCKDFRAVTSEPMTELVQLRLSAERDRQPLFLWAHFTDPHLPYVGGYRAELRRVDQAVGKILASLKRPTIVVIFSDHGESFGSHGIIGHVWRLDEELLRIALVISAPGLAPRVVETPSSLLDLAPTISDLLGLAPPTGWQGRSLLAKQSDPRRAIVFQSRYKDRLNLRGMRLGSYKITQDVWRGSFEIYNVVVDPTDRQELSGENPQLLRHLRHEMARAYDARHNDVQLRRKLRLFDEHAFALPPLVRGPLRVGNARAQR